MKLSAILLGISLCCAYACDREAALSNDDSELLGAPEDSDHKFAVGLCVGEPVAGQACPPRGTPNTVRCSATLVAPNLVLTARHCLFPLEFTQPDYCSNTFSTTPFGNTVRITTSRSVLDAGNTWYNVEDVLLPPGSNNCLDDVALLVLEAPVRRVRPAYINFWRHLDRRSPEEVAIVGRGLVANTLDPQTLENITFDNGGLRRRILENIPFTCAPSNLGDCVVEDYTSSPPEFSLPEGLFAYGISGASGDSGAGVFDQEDFEDGNFGVIGVNTLGTLSAQGTWSNSEAVRLDQHAAFIIDGYRAALEALIDGE